MNQLRVQTGLPPYAAGQIPPDEDYVEFIGETAKRGSQALLAQTADKFAAPLFTLTGRNSNSFPNEIETDYLMRLLAGSTKPFTSILEDTKSMSRLGVQLAREVREAYPGVIDEAIAKNQEGRALFELGEGEGIWNSPVLHDREHFVEKVAPLVQQMNALLSGMPAAYVHGLQGKVQDREPQMALPPSEP